MRYEGAAVRQPRSATPLVLVLAAVLAFFAREGVARAEPVVDLYTVGQGSYLYSTYGHAILCVREAGTKAAEGKGACYDYGVADKEDTLHVLWASLRGVAIFTPVKIDDRTLVSFFEEQGRAIERQTLPLADEEARALATRLERDVTTRWSYAYHPISANCATQLRDRIDEATKGRLRAGLADPGKATFRQRFDAGLTGRMFELAALALAMGPTTDRAPNGWEAMYLPDGLRDGVKERFGVAPEALAERQAVLLPTSAAGGRLALFVLAFALFLTIRLGARRNRLARATTIVGLALGVLALAIDVTALVSTWPEFSRNWCLLVLLPTDLALGFLPRRHLTPYVRARLGMVLVVALLELVGVLAQPLLVAVALVALPMAGLLGALRAATRSEAETGAAPVSTAATKATARAA